MQRSLLIGCGNSRLKKVYYAENEDWTGRLTTLDMDPDCGADVIFDMSVLSGLDMNRGEAYPGFPWDNNTFDEIGAYDVLEHFGKQGDWRGWFNEMAEFHRILKPGGLFGIIVPIGQDALADPGHTRFIHANYFGFLSQKFYEENLAKGAQVTDYRWYYKKNFEILYCEKQGDHHLSVILRKPA